MASRDLRKLSVHTHASCLCEDLQIKTHRRSFIYFVCSQKQQAPRAHSSVKPYPALLSAHIRARFSWMTELLLLRHSLTAAHQQLLPAPGKACQRDDAQWSLSLQPPLSQFPTKNPTPTLHLCLHSVLEYLRHRREYHSAGHLPLSWKNQPGSKAKAFYPLVSRGVLSQGCSQEPRTHCAHTNSPPFEGGISLWEVHFKFQF